MEIALFDTNILIDALNEYPEAVDEITRYKDAAISAISWMEVAVKMSRSEMRAFQQFLNRFPIQTIHTNKTIMVEAAFVRGFSLSTPPKILLPDAIILATAKVSGRLIVTRNPDDFPRAQVRVPYEITNGKVSNVRAPL
jgi:predicted nucleic acid-binding protein